jgi:hypothetical protein
MPSRIYNTPHSVFKEMDRILDDAKDAINNKKIDVELFKKIYSELPLFNETITWDRIEKISEFKFEVFPLGLELFSTAINIKVKLLYRGNRKHTFKNFPIVWYAFATSKNVTAGSINRFIEEVTDFKFFRSTFNGMIYMHDKPNIFKEAAVKVIEMNPNIGDDLRLLAELQ